MRRVLFMLFFIIGFPLGANSQNKINYSKYHKKIIEQEKLIVEESYEEALNKIDEVFTSYDFIFLKDYKIATQLAVQVKDYERAFDYLKIGISNGWVLKEIKKNKFLAPLKRQPQWTKLIKSYPNLRETFKNGVDQELKEGVKQLYKSDQKLAWGYLFRIEQKAKEKYANNKVKPNAIGQIKKLKRMMNEKGYPGEKLIGEPDWMSTILSHHNSVSEDFVKSDTLYENLRPRLLWAIKKGELSPYVFALIEDWRIAVKYDRQKPGFGYIEHLKPGQINASDQLRKQLGIRSIALRNKLVEIQEKTGMDFYLAGSGWVNGKIGE